MQLKNLTVPIILFYSFLMIVLISLFIKVQAVSILILMSFMGYYFLRSMFVEEFHGWQPLMNKKYIWQQWVD